jgi:hypothetical protein
MFTMTEESGRKIVDSIKTGLLLILIVPLLFIVTLPFQIPTILRGISLRFKFRKEVVNQGKFIIFVYSDSPNWKCYIEENIFPQIQDHAIILNWSNRSQWDKTSWVVQSFQHWGGQENFNPLAIVFCNLANVRVIRFYNAFHDFKRGKVIPLQKAETQLFELVTATKKRKPQQNTA